MAPDIRISPWSVVTAVPPVTRWPAAASCALRPLLSGPEHRLVVAAEFPQAVYLADPATERIVSVVVTSDGIAHPNAVRLSSRSSARSSTGMRPLTFFRRGSPVLVRDGRLIGPRAVIEVRRWWVPRPDLRAVTARHLRRRIDAAADIVAVIAPALPAAETADLLRLTEAIRHGRPGRAVDAADLLLGRGPGLTPTGDDLLAGLLAAVSTLRPAFTEPLADASRRAIDAVADRVLDRAHAATTSISAALLGHAVDGEVCGPAAQFLHALAGEHDLTVTPEIPGLLAVGGTSGRDLAIGLLAGARIVCRSDVSGLLERRRLVRSKSVTGPA